MFGLGWGEVIVIGIVALIAIGPKELPTVLRTLAQTMGKIRRMASEFQGQFQEALREAELTDLKKHADDIVSDVTNFDPLADTKKDLEKTQQDLERSFDLADPLATPPATDAAALTDGEKLPAATLPPIDVPLPDFPAQDLPALVTEKDFAPAEPPKEAPKAAAEAIAPEAQKQAGGKV